MPLMVAPNYTVVQLRMTARALRYSNQQNMELLGRSCVNRPA
jgi:hypothetical protein